ncbi:hypothetical protein PENTCL1PPCAC_4973, partial [Pristionchus entomophagus]
IDAFLRVLSAFRLKGELNLRGIDMDTVQANDYDCFQLIPCTYQHMNESSKILITGLFEFCRIAFSEFQLLPISDKAKIFQSLDGEMRVMRRFGKDSSTFLCAYTGYISADVVDNFFSDCPDQKHANSAALILRNWIEETTPEPQKHFCRVEPTEYEFYAMIGLALWSVESIDASDQILALSARYRTEIMEELASIYRETIGEEKGAIRI